MNVVWHHYPQGGGELLLALALADWANDEGRSIEPSVAAAAKKARISTRQTQRLLRTIEQRGYLLPVGETEYGTRRYWLRLDLLQQLPSVYGRRCDVRVAPGDILSPPDAGGAGAASNVADGATNAPENSPAMSPKPFTPSVHPPTPAAVDADFVWPAEIDPALRPRIAAILAGCPVPLRAAVLNEWLGQMARKHIKRPFGYLATLVRRAADGTFAAHVDFAAARHARVEQEAVKRRAAAERAMDARRERWLAQRRSGDE